MSPRLNITSGAWPRWRRERTHWSELRCPGLWNHLTTPELGGPWGPAMMPGVAGLWGPEKTEDARGWVAVREERHVLGRCRRPSDA
ncbi:hypothetical protein NDU88_003866 [Pleurodeles waltl]|uniref:Uncharacterized protein n=1 Tax=Pleurodeles waltl TaxID=8319 RepID=A0AAV7SH50_PLEWA|nr:hypothetical protein NDU88_003866 [Pleurodeles waltl]